MYMLPAATNSHEVQKHSDPLACGSFRPTATWCYCREWGGGGGGGGGAVFVACCGGDTTMILFHRPQPSHCMNTLSDYCPHCCCHCWRWWNLCEGTPCHQCLLIEIFQKGGLILRLLVICFLQLLWLTAVVEEVEEHWNDCEEESDHFQPSCCYGLPVMRR